MIEVVESGAMTLVQDIGRYGHRSAGVATSGAFDDLAARAANRAVGNDELAAVLELTLAGPTLHFHAPALVALTGAPMHGHLDEEAITHGHPIEMPAGARLAIGRASSGLRSYLAVRGGFDAAPVLGSRSTHLAASLGPSPVRRGDRLPIGDLARTTPQAVNLPFPGTRVRVVPTASWHEWQAAVSPASDRTGVRLVLAAGTLGEGAEVDPEPMLPGAIQLPPDGQPIVLGPDAPVTGGYRVIGVVARADRRVLAQARPGTTLTFVTTTPADARQAWKDAARWIDRST